MSFRTIKTLSTVLVSCTLLTACLSASSPTAAQPQYIYGTPDWAVVTPGKVSCSEGKSYTIVRAETGKNMDINWLGKHYTLEHVPTTTGTYRYEDFTSGIVIVQIPEKALLLNAKQGRRLADECIKILN